MHDENPYQSPLESSFVEPVLDPQSLPIASESRRFLNFVVDGIVVRLLGFVVAPFAYPVHVSGWLGFLYGLAVGTLILSVYYVPQEVIWGRTLGKFVTGTKVVSVDGAATTLRQILGRTLCRMIPFECFTFLETAPVGWHDKFSGTRVVMTRSLPARTSGTA